jgi:hypothetical protein
VAEHFIPEFSIEDDIAFAIFRHLCDCGDSAWCGEIQYWSGGSGAAREQCEVPRNVSNLKKWRSGFGGHTPRKFSLI